MAQKTSQNSLRDVALTASKAYRTKDGITVPEWDGAKVTLREPSGDAWVKFREIVNPQLAEGEEAPTLTEAEKFLRNKEADVVLFIDVLLDENGERVFSDEDQELVSKIYGPAGSGSWPRNESGRSGKAVKQPLTFFLMSLALRMGRTLHELRQTITASELKMWIEFDRISPVGDWRSDAQAAQISVAMLNSQGGKFTIPDVMLKWGEQEEGSEVSELEEWMSSL